jgi:hypothetical protein
LLEILPWRGCFHQGAVYEKTVLVFPFPIDLIFVLKSRLSFMYFQLLIVWWQKFKRKRVAISPA